MIRSWFVDEDGKVPFSLSRVVKWDAIPPEIQRALEGEMEEVFTLGNDHSVCACDCVAMAGERVLIVYYKPAKEEE